MSTFGFHLGTGGNAQGIKDDYLIPLDAAGIPATIVSIGDYGICNDAVKLSRISGVGHTIVFRVVGLDVPHYDLSPQEAAPLHWQAILDRLPPEFDKRVWIVPVNEVDKDRSEWLAEFHSILADLAIPDGYRILAFGWAAGEPEYGHWEGEQMLRFLAKCAVYRDYLGIALHEYSYSIEDIKRWFPYLIGRFQFLFDVCDEHKITRPRVMITEWGWEYEDVPGLGTAMEDIAWGDGVYRPWPEVMGAAIWYLGGGFGEIANQVQPLIQPVGQYVLDNPPALPPEPPIEPPPPDETLQQWLWRRSLEEQVLSLNADAALQQVIFDLEHNPNAPEKWDVYPGDNEDYAFQGAQHLGTGNRITVAAKVPDWANIFVLYEPDIQPPDPPTPDPFHLTHLPTTSQRITQYFGELPEYIFLIVMAGTTMGTMFD